MSSPMQLTIDGREVPHPPVTSPPHVIDVLIDSEHRQVQLRPRRGGIPLDVQETIVRLYARGEPMSSITAQTFVSASGAYKLLREAGVRRQRVRANYVRGGAATGTLLHASQLYGQGYASTEIADVFGVAESTVRRWLARLDVPRRSMSDALRLSYARGRHPVTFPPRSHDE